MQQYVLCYVMLCYVMLCNAMQCNAMQCNAMQCNAMQCNAMQCNAMQECDDVCYAMLCIMMLQLVYNEVHCSALQSVVKQYSVFYSQSSHILTVVCSHLSVYSQFVAWTSNSSTSTSTITSSMLCGSMQQYVVVCSSMWQYGGGMYIAVGSVVYCSIFSSMQRHEKQQQYYYYYYYQYEGTMQQYLVGSSTLQIRAVLVVSLIRVPYVSFV